MKVFFNRCVKVDRMVLKERKLPTLLEATSYIANHWERHCRRSVDPLFQERERERERERKREGKREREREMDGDR